MHRAVDEALAGSGDEAWVESHLLALVGLAAEAELGGDRRNEAFAAWQRFLEAMAEQRPLVLVFEDLHWADESLLDFVDEFVEWVTDVPLLVVGTARPELFERRPGWGGGKLNSTTLALAPLTDDQTALLIGQLLAKPVVEAGSQQTLLERAGGNPLYAEQFAELFLERGSTDELPLPETLQGIIAARLDGLPEAEKGLLQDAAVVGKVFWGSALQGSSDVAVPLRSLERKGFVRRQKRSSVQGENEFAFAHALVRDVSYGQIARADRAEKHRRTAEWIDSLGRPQDHAEMLAHHWRSALDLVRASGGDDGAIAVRTRLALRGAGDRALALNSFTVAAAQYDDALALWPADDEGGRADVMFRRAHALHLAGAEHRERVLEEARDAALAAGNAEHAAEAQAFLAEVAWIRGQPDLVFEHLDRAHDLIAGGRPSPARARVLAVAARYRAIGGEPETAKKLAHEALELAETLGLDELRAHALGTIGLARTALEGPAAGIADLRRALDIALAASSRESARLANNLAAVMVETGDYRAGVAMWEESWLLGERFGWPDQVRFSVGVRAWILYDAGRWDEAFELADAFIAECDAGSPNYQQGGVQGVRAKIRAARGDWKGAQQDLRRAEQLASAAKDPQAVIPILANLTWVYAEHGMVDEARRVTDGLLRAVAQYPRFADVLFELAFHAREIGVEEELRAVFDGAQPSKWKEVAVAMLDRDFEHGVAVLDEMGVAAMAADLRLRLADARFAAGRRAEGEAELAKALAFYRSAGASFYVDRIEQLLEKSA
jgi:tetratricopeptide (TPR) repeat protein